MEGCSGNLRHADKNPTFGVTSWSVSSGTRLNSGSPKSCAGWHMVNGEVEWARVPQEKWMFLYATLMYLVASLLCRPAGIAYGQMSIFCAIIFDLLVASFSSTGFRTSRHFEFPLYFWIIFGSSLNSCQFPHWLWCAALLFEELCGTFPCWWVHNIWPLLENIKIWEGVSWGVIHQCALLYNLPETCSIFKLLFCAGATS